MAEERRKFAVVFLAVVVGLLVGALLTELFGFVLPTGVVRTFFMKEVSFGIDPIHLDLALIEITFGFSLGLNFLSLVAIALTIYYFKWWL